MIRTALDALRHGTALDAATLRGFVAAIADGRADDAQVGAFAMGICLRGLPRAGCATLTLAMRDSGQVLDWRGHALHGPLLDKHSTGGVGDLVSLLLAPLLAACGAHVPMISGRGLGHTGGTLDKLEAIPGFECRLPQARFQRIVAEVGAAIVGAGAELAPADARLYAVRDVTGTVGSIPLIVASILSKKLAAGLDALVLDVKYGNGALLDSREASETLADELAAVAELAGLRCRPLLTDMAQPLAPCAGNAIEVQAALDCLSGRTRPSRLIEVTFALGVQALLLGRLAEHEIEARAKLRVALDSGRAAERFAAMVQAQGGPADLLERAGDHLPQAPLVRPLLPAASGVVQAIDVRTLGLAVVDLGGGRQQAGQAIDPAVGLSLLPALGETVDRERPLAMIHARSEADWQRAAEQVTRAFRLAEPGSMTGPDTDSAAKQPPAAPTVAGGGRAAAVGSVLLAEAAPADRRLLH
jgi:thymidine phosphorylase